MSEPVFSDVVERAYGLMPDHFRRSDKRNEWALKKYLSGMLTTETAVAELLARLDFDTVDDGGKVGDSSELGDPARADTAWLPWIAQLVGIDPRTVDERSRSDIIESSSGFKGGTKGSIARAAATALVGEQFVRVFPRSTPDNIGGGTQWDILLVTRSTETLKNLLDRGLAESISPGYWGVTVASMRTNMTRDPSMTTLNSKTAGGNATIAISTAWAKYGTTSVCVTPSGTNRSSAVYSHGSTGASNLIGWVAGRTYTVSATIYVPDSQTGSLDVSARRIAIGVTTASGTQPVYAQSDPAPNELSETRVSVTFTIPADASNAFIRLMNGSANADELVYWDGLLIEESDKMSDYFDGDTTDTADTTYSWVGTTNASLSTCWYSAKPQVTRTTREGYYLNRAISVVPNGIGQSDVTIVSTSRYEATATTEYLAMLTVQSDQDITFSANFGLQFYNSSGAVISTLTQPRNISATRSQISARFTAPAGTASAAIYLKATGLRSIDSLVLGQPGARIEDTDIWIPASADPVGTVIAKGAKPAGVRLWHQTFAASWAAVEENYPTWAAWQQARIWTKIEEAGLD